MAEDGGQSLDEQLCIWTNNNSTRIGCSAYTWEGPGGVLKYSPAADFRRGTWIWTRLWVSNSLITTYKDYFS